MDLPEGIFRISIPNATNDFYVNAYTVRVSQDRWILIDSGWGNEISFKELSLQLLKIGVGSNEVKDVLLTHTHPDHIGNATYFRNMNRAVVTCHQLDLSFMIRYHSYEKFVHLTRDWLRKHINSDEPSLAVLNEWNFSSKSIETATPSVLIRRKRQEIKIGGLQLIALHTPGHSPGHVCYFDPERGVLFSGDHILPGETPNISLSFYYNQNPLKDYVDSLETVTKLKGLKYILPGHGEPFSNLQGILKRLTVHHERRLAEILEATSQERTAWEVAHRVSWSRGKLGKLTPFQQRQALGETLAHLKYLEAEGKVSELMKKELIKFIRKH